MTKIVKSYEFVHPLDVSHDYGQTIDTIAVKIKVTATFEGTGISYAYFGPYCVAVIDQAIPVSIDISSITELPSKKDLLAQWRHNREAGPILAALHVIARNYVRKKFLHLSKYKNTSDEFNTSLS